MTIKEVEKKLNISRANIRFYEKEGLLEPKRCDNEYRDYSEDDLKRLEKILLFRKCNISIENIRLIFNGTKRIDEIFKEQISVIENEVKQLEGAKLMCKKLAQEKSSVDKMDANKYINIMNSEEQKGNKFYNITEYYIFATEKLYQSIIESEEFKGGDRMKKGLKFGLYALSALMLFGFAILFDLIFKRPIDWTGAIIFTAVFTAADIIGVKKYIESKTGEKYTRKDYLKHSLITILIAVVVLFAYSTVAYIYNINKEPNNTVLEASVRKAILDIAYEKYENTDNNLYAESHKIIDFEVKGDEIYAYVVANYGLFNQNNCEVVNDTKNTLTLIYNEEKNKEGIYELKEYKENSVPDKLKEKTNVNFEDTYYRSQLELYCNR